MTQACETEGVRVVLSAPQLAAVLSNQSISPSEMLSNRLWGGWQVVGGVLEMAGAAALCIAPEPTGLTKLGCIAFGVHGSDTVAAGARQMWTGRDTITLTQQGTSKLAEAMKAPPEMANNIGLSLDIGVSFGVAGIVKATRVGSVTMGRINLLQHEATAANPRLGGHTLLKHVARTDDQLHARLKAEPLRNFVSTFTSRESAEWAISEILRTGNSQIRAWARSSLRSPLPLRGSVSKDVGRVLSRETGKITSARKVTVILNLEVYNGMPYYILTAFVR